MSIIQKINVNGVNYDIDSKQIYIGSSQPTDENIVLWVDTTTEAELTGISIEQTANSVTVGNTITMNIKPIPSDASLSEATYSWTILSGSNYVSLSSINNRTITVSGVSVGTATIRCVVAVDNVSYTANTNLSVVAAPISPTGIELSAETASVNVGRTYNLTASVIPLNATYQNVTYSWSASGDILISYSGNSCIVTGTAIGVGIVNCVGIVDGTEFSSVSCEFTVTEASELPEEYQRVEYVCALASQTFNVINTQIRQNEISKFEIGLETDFSNYVCIASGCDTDAQTATGDTTTQPQMSKGTILNTLQKSAMVGDKGITISSVTPDSSEYVGENTKVDFTFNISSAGEYYFCLGGCEQPGWRPTDLKIYYTKFYNVNNKIADFVPCYRKSDNKVGMYDIVRQRFYTVVFGRDWIKGVDV